LRFRRAPTLVNLREMHFTMEAAFNLVHIAQQSDREFGSAVRM
jgi:hypothetical protein